MRVAGQLIDAGASPPEIYGQLAREYDQVAGIFIRNASDQDANDPRFANAFVGLPRERWDWLRAISDEIVDILDPFRGFDPESLDGALHDLSDYILELAAERRADPQDDLITEFVRKILADYSQLVLWKLKSFVALVLVS